MRRVLDTNLPGLAHVAGITTCHLREIFDVSTNAPVRSTAVRRIVSHCVTARKMRRPQVRKATRELHGLAREGRHERTDGDTECPGNFPQFTPANNCTGAPGVSARLMPVDGLPEYAERRSPSPTTIALVESSLG